KKEREALRKKDEELGGVTEEDEKQGEAGDNKEGEMGDGDGGFDEFVAESEQQGEETTVEATGEVAGGESGESAVNEADSSEVEPAKMSDDNNTEGAQIEGQDALAKEISNDQDAGDAQEHVTGEQAQVGDSTEQSEAIVDSSANEQPGESTEVAVEGGQESSGVEKSGESEEVAVGSTNESQETNEKELESEAVPPVAQEGGETEQSGETAVVAQNEPVAEGGEQQAELNTAVEGTEVVGEVAADDKLPEDAPVPEPEPTIEADAAAPVQEVNVEKHAEEPILTEGQENAPQEPEIPAAVEDVPAPQEQSSEIKVEGEITTEAEESVKVPVTEENGETAAISTEDGVVGDQSEPVAAEVPAEGVAE
ncbi:hypothetical protein HDU76_004416, partial [Blyttiomyces sp. JEL0837]